MSELAQKKSTRILTFDLLRGYFLVSIILNHLSWYPNGLDWVAMRGSLLVSAAEGFFLISGIILGIVRGRALLDKPFKKAAGLLVKRGIHLYIVSIILMLAFTLIGWWFFMDNPGLKAGIRPIDQPLNEVIFGALTFNYIYGWADYLRLYSIFIILSPIALWLLRKKLWYVLLAACSVVWLLFPAPGTSEMTNELLMPIAWQLIFFGGFTIGFHWKDITAFWNKIALKWRKGIIATVATVAITTIILSMALAVSDSLSGAIGDSARMIAAHLQPHFIKESLPIPRLILFMIWFWFGFWVFTKFQPFIVKWAGWILLPFGNNSLYVYIIHAFIIFFAHLIMPASSSNLFVNAIGTLAVLAIIWLCVRYKVLMKIIPR